MLHFLKPTGKLNSTCLKLLRRNESAVWIGKASYKSSSICCQKVSELPKDVDTPFPDAYNAHNVEEGWYNWWKDNGYFTPSTKSADSIKNKDSSKTFSIILPPPNVTGQLHLGHALTATIQDALVRWHRMRGFDTVWVPGSDHAGIATQVVVEKWLQTEKGLTRHQLGREKFLQEVWKWRQLKGDEIFKQLERMGASLDWNRTTFTMDEAHSRAVNHAFVQLFNSKLIYRGNFLVNWSTRLQSAISDIEVDHVEITKKTKLSIPGIDKPVEVGLIFDVAYKLYQYDGHSSSSDEIVVSTTRPETLLGDVAVAVHPSDIRYAHLIGRKLVHPFRKCLDGLSLIPVIADESVNPEFGTGAVKVTPGHDQTDFDIGKRHLLPILDVIDKEGNIQFQILDKGQNENFLNFSNQTFNTSGDKFKGLPRFTARWSILGELKSLGLFRGQREHPMKIPVCSRSGDIIEPLLKPQWFLKVSEMNKQALEAEETGQIRLDPKVNEKLWKQWLSSDRDWCISRQLWWGHQIPVWNLTWETCKDEYKSIWIPAASLTRAHQKAQRITNSNDYKLYQDEDVLDTWFSSAILPFSNFGWPKWTDDLDRYFPLSIMETGHDILFFWVARMVLLSQQLTGKLPFQKVLLHGIICDSQGQKMSKSLGNVIDPLSVIDGKPLKNMELDLIGNTSLAPAEKNKALVALKKDFPEGIPELGTDALRFGLCTYDIKGHYINLDLKKMKTASAFCNKIWQATRFYIQAADRLRTDSVKLAEFDQFLKKSTSQQLEELNDGFRQLQLVDKWILSQCSETVSSLNENLSDADFHYVARNLRNFFYTCLCDVYLESVKIRISDVTREDFLVPLCVLHMCLQTGLTLAHPIMPFISEELFQRLAKQNNVQVQTIMLQKYPENEEWQHLNNQQLKNQIEFVLEMISQLRAVKQFYNLKRIHRPTVKVLLSSQQKEEANLLTSSPGDLSQLCDLIQTLVPTGTVQIENTQEVDVSELQKIGWSSSRVPNHECVVLVNVASHIDVTRERHRIQEKKEKVEKDVKKLKVALSKAKYGPENAADLVIAKINASHDELSYLNGQLIFLNSLQSWK